MNFQNLFSPILTKAPDEQAAALVRVFLFRLTMDFLLLFGAERDHRVSSPQKLSLKSFSPPSHRIVTRSEPGCKVRARRNAAKTFAPELTPTSKPSSRASRLVISCASSVA